MAQIILIAIGAGLASALLFASLVSASLFAKLLFYLAPLPILIAGMGWSYWAGLIAALSATLCLAIVFGGLFGLAFFLSVGLPAWWLGYLALLARPGEGPTGSIEWYPVGRLILWSSVVGALTVIVSIPFFGTDAETFHTNLRSAIEAALGLTSPSEAGTNAPAKILDTDLLATLAPPMMASLTAIILVINLWLAARIVAVSGQLRRPWPDLSAIAFPPLTRAFLAAAIAGIFLPGLLGVVSDILAATLIVAYAILGFAVLHTVTRGFTGRSIVLTGVYAVVIMFGWPALILAVLGLSDSALDLRGRAVRKQGPPTLH